MKQTFDKNVVIQNLNRTLNNYIVLKEESNKFVDSLIGIDIKFKYFFNPITWFIPHKTKLTKSILEEWTKDNYHVANINNHNNIIEKIKTKISFLNNSVDRDVVLDFEEFNEIDDNFTHSEYLIKVAPTIQEEFRQDLKRNIWR